MSVGKGCVLTVVMVIALCIVWPFWYCVLPVFSIMLLVCAWRKAKRLNTALMKVCAICGSVLGIGALCACVCMWHWVLPIVIVFAVLNYVSTIKAQEEMRVNAIMETEGERRKMKVAAESAAAEEARQAKWKQEEVAWAEWKKGKDRFIESWFSSAYVILDTNVWMETAKETAWIEWVPRPGISDSWSIMMDVRMGLSKIDMSKMMPAIKIDQRNISEWPYKGDYDPNRHPYSVGGGNVRKFGQRKYGTLSGWEGLYWEVEEWKYIGFWRDRVWANPGSTLLEILSSDACGKAKVVVPGAQLDELVNITHKNPPNSPKWNAAQKAINRLQSLQKMGRVDMPDVKAQPDRWAYLDAMLGCFVAKNKEESVVRRPIRIVTFDRELSVRLRGIADGCKDDTIEILDKDDLIMLLTSSRKKGNAS